MNPMETNTVRYIITYRNGAEWGFFSLEQLQARGLTPASRNVRDIRSIRREYE